MKKKYDKISPKTHWVGVRLNDSEKKDLDKLSEILGLDTSDTIRRAISECYVKHDQDQWVTSRFV